MKRPRPSTSPPARNYPPLFLLFVTALLVAPLLNVAGLVLNPGGGLSELPARLSRLGVPTLILRFVPPFIGVGLLLVNRFAWYAVLAYAALLTGVHAHALTTHPLLSNVHDLLGTLFGLSLMLYFLSKNVYAPFRHGRGGGWRRSRRLPVRLGVVLDGMHLLVRDLSVKGMFVYWASHPLNPGDQVAVSLTLGNTTLHLPARVARATRRGVGLEFLSVTREQKKAIKRFLRHPQEPDRFRAQADDRAPDTASLLPG